MILVELTTIFALLLFSPNTSRFEFRSLEVDGLRRSYYVYTPKDYRPERPSPVVLAYHGGGLNARFMAAYSRLNAKADQAGFLAVYPNGYGVADLFLLFNGGGLISPLDALLPDDVAFTEALLDDLAKRRNIDPDRIYATGYSNGGQLCYLLASKLSHRIAAIAPVSGTQARDFPKPERPVSVMHFHGTADRIVPFDGPEADTPWFLDFLSVDETIAMWEQNLDCTGNQQQALRDRYDDGTSVTQTTYTCPEDSELVLLTIEGGGHTWPGSRRRLRFLGRTTREVSANDLMWDFFRRHSRPSRRTD